MFMSGHGDHHTRCVDIRNRQSLIELHGSEDFTVRMIDVAKRIRQRMTELGVSQAEVARACGWSPARLGNYVNENPANNRTPDVESLGKLARALGTTSDWLLGLSEAGPIDVKAVLQRILELDGLAKDRAEVIAQVAQESLRLLASLPDDGDARTRALVAAQAAWNVRPSAKPN